MTRLEGIVVQGERRGRTIGFPTANIDLPPDSPIPAHGVYAGLLDGRPAAVSIGTRPTFRSRLGVLIEAHVLDFHGSLYGQRVVLELLTRLRDEQRFETADELVAQIRRDVAATRAVCARCAERH
ncbi:riboflavin kinase [Conexibacter sp. CPCC 206217]|uniref:riboflavin kinase n=1 Tax=Conexibacter sp. CPCC 206217 TaxID=3064574 RepID=UPI002728C6A7|nr:riboflavin kinase [Conexibacter sp. CPCC 206217]MDO8212025.1 riboflavin kinase [Conexibacter sp. CPCC 206217]